MHYYVSFAVVADSADDAKSEVETFLFDYRTEWDYFTFEKIVSLTDSDAAADALGEVDRVADRRAAQIASRIEMFKPLAGADGVVTTLNPDGDTWTTTIRRLWTETLNTNGRALTIADNSGNDAVHGLALYELRKTLRFMGDTFYNEVGFYDIEEQCPHTRWLAERISTDPERQWIVHVDLHN
jgi:hypothetical protein